MSNIGRIGGGSFGVGPDSSDDAPATTAGASTQATRISLGSAELSSGGRLDAVASGSKELGLGARGDDVKAMQEQLAKLGYPIGTPDGIFGRGSERQVSAFQKEQGIPTTGRFDQATLAALDRALQLGDKKNAAATPRNDLVFLAMGDGGAHEVADLKRRGVNILGITDSAAGDDKVKIGTRTHDLTTEAGISGFVDSLGVSGPKKQELVDILEGCSGDGRDEAALAMKTFLEAERGDREIERFVMSGHSVGDGVWGDKNGEFSMDTLAALCKAFPRAAGQVEDFMIAGCYSSSEQHVEQFREMFPNLKTSWAYGQSAPGTWSGAMVHNSRWEAATRGDDYGKMDRGLAAGTRKGENVATWNIEDGYMADGATRPVAEVRRELQGLQPTFDSYFSGRETIQDTQYGPMRDYYRTVQELLGNPATPASERPALEEARDQAIRVIFYDHVVKGKIQSNYGPTLQAGFQALGLPAPDFSKLSRSEALAKVAEFERKLASTNPKPRAAETALPLLTNGVRDLDRAVIPNNWV